MIKYLLLFLFAIVTSVRAEPLTIITWATGQQPYANTLLVGKYMKKYLPNVDDVMIKVVPGAGSLNAVNYLYNNVSKDSYTIGTFTRSIAIRSIMDDDKNIKFDISKFVWLGSTSDGRKDPTVLLSHKSLNEELVIGEQNSSELSVVDIAIKTTNLKIKKVSGYKDLSEMRLAFLRKEIDAFFNNYSGALEYDINMKSKIILQYGNGTIRNSELKDIPTLSELSNNKTMINAVELSYAIARPYVAPTNISQEKAALLRTAFENVTKDPEYLEEAKKFNIETTFITWQKCEEMLNQLSKLKSSFVKSHLSNE